MRVSDKWLRELVDVTDDKEVIANKMLSVGNEYESINELCPSTNLVVGRVVSKYPHPDSDHLNVCEVDLGDKICKIVCGAPNVCANQKVIVAKVGAKLPAGEIKCSTIRGVLSNGMICSLAELGLESKYVKEEDKKGIHVLNEDAPVGVDAKEYLNYNDSYTDYELTSNRGDLLSMIGMAYEVGAIYNKKVKMPEINLTESKEKTSDYIEIENQTNNCYAYKSRIVKNVVIKESPSFIKARLMSSGIRPINNVVDISNYVMLEFGEPLHFFDLDKLGGKIIIRQARDKEEITTLDNVKRTLKDSDIVISDEYHPVALAGVMGGLDTEVTLNTTNILIEAAIFNPYNIRYTSKEILRSEASLRFEKGIDPNIIETALNRAAYLLEKYANGTVLNGIVGFNDRDLNDKEILLSLDKIVSVLGMDVKKEDVIDILDRLNFKCREKDNVFKVYVPTRRLDVNIKEDIIEEIGRMYGYDNMKGTLPVVKIKRGQYLSKNRYIKDIKNRLSALSLNEVITYSLVNKKEIDLFKDENFEYIKVASPLTEDKSIMRYSLIPSLLKVADYNMSRNIKDINIYEISKVYYILDGYKETNKLAILMSGDYIDNSWGNKMVVDFYLIKGVLENLFDYLGVLNRYKLRENNNVYYHKGVSAEILIDNISVGYIGKPHPTISKKDIYVCELNLDKIFDIKTKNIKSKEIPKYPSVVKDVAFILDNSICVGDVINTIYKKGGRIVNNVDVFDVFNNIEECKKSVAFKITYQDISKTLTDEEVTKSFENIISCVSKEYNGVLRNK